MKQISTRVLSLALCFIMLLSCCVTVTAADLEPIKDLKLNYVTSDSLSVSWSEVDNAQGYRVYRYVLSEKKWRAVKNTTALIYSDADVVPAEVYYYRVKAYTYVNSEPVFSSKSNTVKVIVPPEKVTGLRVTAYSENSISITWNKQEKASGYQVFVYNPTAKKYQHKANVSGNSYILTDLNEGTSYKIAVKAYVINGETAYGNFSTVLTATTKGPVVPTKLKGTSYPTKGEIRLSWTGAGNNDGYVVHFYDSTTGTWKDIATTKSTSYTVKDISETSTYTYAVSAYTNTGGKTYYSAKSQSVEVYFKSPNAPDSGYSQEMADNGILGYLFDPAEMCFYTAADPWQRTVGYNAIFDVCAPFVFIDFDTVRLDFRYKNKDWRVQLWKGQYGLAFYGCEVGVYTKPTDRKLAHYNCASDEEMLMMEVRFLQKKSSLNGDVWVEKFSRPYGAYWWCTGFIPGNIFGNFDKLKLDMHITMKDYEMLSGFTAALKENGISYYVKGLDVYFMYE